MNLWYFPVGNIPTLFSITGHNTQYVTQWSQTKLCGAKQAYIRTPSPLFKYLFRGKKETSLEMKEGGS